MSQRKINSFYTRLSNRATVDCGKLSYHVSLEVSLLAFELLHKIGELNVNNEDPVCMKIHLFHFVQHRE